MIDERAKAYRVEYYRANKDRQDALHKAWKAANPDKHKWYQLKYRYGITQEQWQSLLAQQNGACAICGIPADKYDVDHDHACCPQRRSCGSCIRGLLCGTCNRGISQLKDDPNLLRKAAAYLERPNGTT